MPRNSVKSENIAQSSTHRIFMGKLGIDSFLFTVFGLFKIVCTHRHGMIDWFYDVFVLRNTLSVSRTATMQGTRGHYVCYNVSTY